MNFGQGISVEFTSTGYALLRMSSGENRLNYDFLTAMHKALDFVESKEDCKALITTGQGKFFCNGVDLEIAVNPSILSNLFAAVGILLNRLRIFPLPTVAAINGHAFAGGAFLALAHDYRVMNAQRGWICWNEIDINTPIPKEGIHFMRHILSPIVLRDGLLFGKRFAAQEALSNELVDVVTDDHGLIEASVELLARVIDKSKWQKNVIAAMKKNLYAPTVSSKL
ncbi:hypothetical protein ScPMuIL_001895 [Solemya velum]